MSSHPRLPAVAVALVATMALLAMAPAVGGAKPDILFLLGDDTGWYNLGFHNPKVHTPNLNSLAANGILLERHYAFMFCSPTRSALMSGRLPYRVNEHNSAEWGWTGAPVHPKMTMLPAKLKQAGYSTYHLGKWHLGLSRPSYTPTGRGFDESLGFLSGSEDHYTQRKGEAVDLWDSGAAALGQNGTYSAMLYGTAAVRMIEKQPSATPLFMYLAFQVTHEPEQVPQRFADLYSPTEHIAEWRTYNGMSSAMDEAIGNVTAALKRTGRWDNTLLLFSSDNGGPSLVGGASCANNYPLRGGKGNNFEGGVRVAALVSGGLVPARLRGSTTSEYIHVADWYSTACRLAGVDPADDAPGIPGIDSLDMTDLILGRNASGPRREMVLWWDNFTVPHPHAGQPAYILNSAFIQGRYKILTGRQANTGLWWGPEYPNSTVKPNASDLGCPSGCLFDIVADPSEHRDLRETSPALFDAMWARLLHLAKQRFQSDINGTTDMAGAEGAIAHGFWHPWLPDATDPLV